MKIAILQISKTKAFKLHCFHFFFQIVIFQKNLGDF